MIIVRNTFRLKFGTTREALAVMKEGIAIQKRIGIDVSQRLLTDLTGEFYTMVLELALPLGEGRGPVGAVRNLQPVEHRGSLKSGGQPCRRRLVHTLAYAFGDAQGRVKSPQRPLGLAT